MMQTFQTEAIALQRTDVTQILQLRHQVLRQGYAIAEVFLLKTKTHLAAITEHSIRLGITLAVYPFCPLTGKANQPGDFGPWQRQKVTAIKASDQS